MPWQLKSAVPRSGSATGNGATGLETGVTGRRFDGCSTGASVWLLTSVVARDRDALPANSTALDPAPVVTLVALDPEVDAGAPQAARYRAAPMHATTFFTAGYNAGLPHLSRLAATVRAHWP